MKRNNLRFLKEYEKRRRSVGGGKRSALRYSRSYKFVVDKTPMHSAVKSVRNRRGKTIRITNKPTIHGAVSSYWFRNDDERNWISRE